MADVDADLKDVWATGDSYEQYVGRWSRLVAHEFLDWLEPSDGLRWTDVGCGTGALATTILTQSNLCPWWGSNLRRGSWRLRQNKSGTRGHVSNEATPANYPSRIRAWMPPCQRSC